MRLHGLIFSLGLVPLLATGCIVTKDMEDDDTAGSESDSSTTSPGSESGVVSTTSDTDGGSSSSTTGPDDTTTSTDGASSSSTTDPTEGGSESSDSGGTDDQSLCESTGGTWDMTACGHYDCGLPNECAAVIPGCDCGTAANFVDGQGCVDDDQCLEATFACGPTETCTMATEYCEVFVPGIPGPNSYSCMPLPNACIGDGTCACLAGQGIPGPEGMCTPVPGGGAEVEILGA